MILILCILYLAGAGLLILSVAPILVMVVWELMLPGRIIIEWAIENAREVIDNILTGKRG